MFGYIRPDMGELKVKEFGRFRACYCGLCHELGREYGIFSRLILNYDFVFLAMLLDRGKLEYEMQRCVAAPFSKRCVCARSDALARAAGYSVILAYWKLCDEIEDERFFKALSSRIKRLFFKGAFQCASSRYPAFSASVEMHLRELSELEAAEEMSVDKMADKFARLLASAADESREEAEQRLLYELLYHVGRIIYIADAVEDLKEDMSDGRYNPLIARFSLKTPQLSDEEKENVKLGLLNSQSRICAAFELMEDTHWTCIVRNIIYDGIPVMCSQVLDGTYHNTRTRFPQMGEDR